MLEAALVLCPLFRMYPLPKLPKPLFCHSFSILSKYQLKKWRAVAMLPCTPLALGIGRRTRENHAADKEARTRLPSSAG